MIIISRLTHILTRTMSLPKISKTIGVIARLWHFVPQSTLLNLYRSLIFPYLSYGLIAWGQASKSNLNKVLMPQKRVIRLVHFLLYRDHSLPFLCHLIFYRLSYFTLKPSPSSCMMVRMILHRKTSATPLLAPDKYTHITPDQPLLEIFMLNRLD